MSIQLFFTDNKNRHAVENSLPSAHTSLQGPVACLRSEDAILALQGFVETAEPAAAAATCAAGAATSAAASPATCSATFHACD